MGEVRLTVEKGMRTLVTTFTVKMAEDLTEYLSKNGIRARYIHHTVETMERQEILRDLRLGTFDVLVGVNLLREGLDLPEVGLVAILDADKEGFLRSESALIQTIGRAARNVEGRVIMYADKITEAMSAAIGETERRRRIQQAYNDAHGITPQSVKKAVRDLIEIGKREAQEEKQATAHPEKKLSGKEKEAYIESLTREMKKAAEKLDFERAAHLRDRIRELKTTK
jgi:excinuclease ABC subunit B